MHASSRAYIVPFHSIWDTAPVIISGRLVKVKKCFRPDKTCVIRRAPSNPGCHIDVHRPLGGPGFDLLENPPEGESRMISWGPGTVVTFGVYKCVLRLFTNLKYSDVILNSLEENCRRRRYFPQTETFIFKENNNFENIHIHSTQIIYKVQQLSGIAPG